MGNRIWGVSKQYDKQILSHIAWVIRNLSENQLSMIGE